MTTLEELEARMNAQDTKIALQESYIQELGNHVSDLSEMLGKLMKTPAKAGVFPSVATIERIDLQIFDYDAANLTPNQRRNGTTGWSMKFQFWCNGNQQPDIDVTMLKGKHLLAKLEASNSQEPVPAQIMSIANVISEPTDGQAYGGIVRRKTMGRGSPYVPSQVVVMIGHDRGIEDLCVNLLIEDKHITFNTFRPARGTGERKARWYGLWMPPK